MDALSNRSMINLSECHEDLRKLFLEVSKYYKFEIIEGHRTKNDQDKYFESKKSKLQWPNSKHNSIPSKALDAAPLPIDWNDINSFILFAGFVLGIASIMKIKIRWGGDWNSNLNMKDENFRDLVHFELTN